MADKELLAVNNQERMIVLSYRLQQLGVSYKGVDELLAYDLDVVEKQLDYLPYRFVKRPEAFIVEAIRNNYSPPASLFYARPEATDPE